MWEQFFSVLTVSKYEHQIMIHHAFFKKHALSRKRQDRNVRILQYVPGYWHNGPKNSENIAIYFLKFKKRISFQNFDTILLEQLYMEQFVLNNRYFSKLWNKNSSIFFSNSKISRLKTFLDGEESWTKEYLLCNAQLFIWKKFFSPKFY